MHLHLPTKTFELMNLLSSLKFYSSVAAIGKYSLEIDFQGI